MVDDYIFGFGYFRKPDKQGYLAAARDRLVTTLNLIPRLPNPERVRVLEIGGAPYFMTVLVEKFFGYRVEVANEPTFESARPATSRCSRTTTGTGTRSVQDPEHRIRQVAMAGRRLRHRLVLRGHRAPGLRPDPHPGRGAPGAPEGNRPAPRSTPNACYTYLVQMVRGQNFYPPYSGWSHYARHHRLFSPAELVHLCARWAIRSHTTRSTTRPTTTRAGSNRSSGRSCARDGSRAGWT